MGISPDGSGFGVQREKICNLASKRCHVEVPSDQTVAMFSTIGKV